MLKRVLGMILLLAMALPAFADEPISIGISGRGRLINAWKSIHTVGVSRRPGSWDEVVDIIAQVPNGTPCELLEKKTYPLIPGKTLVRIKVTCTSRGRRITGWVHEGDVKR